jgi:hypothetical protein
MKRSATSEWRYRTKLRMIESFGSKCCICGYSKCVSALDFHHLNPQQKDFSPSAARASSSSWQKICDELRKCVMVCANCHREIHSGYIKVPDDAQRFDESYADYRAKLKLKDMNDCPVCGQKKMKYRTTCSKSCAARYSYRVDWDSIDLKQLKVAGKSNVEIGKLLGVSDGAVIKRLKKLGLYDKFRCKHARPNKTIRHRAKSIRKKAIV